MKSTAFSFDLDAEDASAEIVLSDIATALNLMLELPVGSGLSIGQRLMVTEAAERCDVVSDELTDDVISKHHGEGEVWGEDDDDAATTPTPVITRNGARCRRCGDIIESRHRWDMVWCKCGSIAVDGGHDYLRRAGDPGDLEELSEHRWPDPP